MIRDKHRETIARLHNVNMALSQWDEWDAAQNLPEGFDIKLEKPILTRTALKSQQKKLIAKLMDSDSNS